MAKRHGRVYSTVGAALKPSPIRELAKADEAPG
jgi:hypothetical protein